MTQKKRQQTSISWTSRTFNSSDKYEIPKQEKPWSPLDAKLLSRSFMVETHSGGMIEPVPGFARRRAVTTGLLRGHSPSVTMPKTHMESVIGDDDRVEIAETAAIPWRSICQLLIERQDGSSAYGTGWFAGPQLIVTAGHCLLNHEHGQWASRITVVPGSNGSYPPPFGTVEVEEIKVHPNWEHHRDETHDYGFILLRDATIGRALGWFGFAALDDQQVQSMIVNIAGYPDDKPKGTMWFNSGRIIQAQPSHLIYMIDTEPGQSGAPVFWYGNNQQRIVVAIHIASEANYNKGTRITQELYSGIKEFRGF